MGLFSGSDLYYAYAASSSVIDKPKSTFTAEIIKATLGDGVRYGIANAINFAIVTDMYARAKSMLRYASKDDGYVRGFPESNMNFLRVDPQQIENALSRAIGNWDSITSTYLGSINERFLINMKLQELYLDTSYFPWGVAPEANWDEGSDTIQIPVINPDTGTYYEAPNTPNYSHTTQHADRLDELEGDFLLREIYDQLMPGEYNVSFDYTDNLGNPATFEVPKKINIGAYQDSQSFVQVKYVVSNATNYWLYEAGSDLDPLLEAHIEREDRYGQYFPVMVLMQDEIWFDSVPDSLLDITTNKMIKRLGTSAYKIKEQFLEQAEEDKRKKKEGQVWDFIMHFAVPIHSRVRGSMQYIHQFFKQLEAWQTYTYPAYYEYLATSIGYPDSGYTSSQPINELIIKEAGDNGYNVAYRWSFIHTIDYPGQGQMPDVEVILVDPEDPESEIITRDIMRDMKPREVNVEIYERSDKTTWVEGYWQGGEWEEEPSEGEPGVPNPDRVWVPGYWKGDATEYQAVIDEFFGPGTPVGQWTDSEKEKDLERVGYHDIVVITYQNPIDLENPSVPQGYTRTLVMGISMQYTINTRDITGKVNTDYRFRYARPKLFGLKEDTQEFRLPIHAAALKEVSRMHREEILQDSLTATVFLVQKIHVSWYQTGFFKWLIIIIAIILIVLSVMYAGGAGTEEGVSLIAAMVSATGATGWAAFVLYVVFSFAVGYIISLAAGLIGGTWGKIFAIVAAVVMIYSASASGNGVGANWQKFAETPGWATAGQFIASVGAYYEIGFSVYADYKLGKLQDDYTNFMQTHQERMEELEDKYYAINQDVNTSAGIDPLDLSRTFQNQMSWETPEQFLNRTTQTNPGQLAIEYVYNFPEAALSLPKAPGQPSIIDGLFADLENQRNQGAVT